MPTKKSTPPHRWEFHSFHRWVLGFSVMNICLITGLLWAGVHSIPQVRSWNWANSWVMSHDRVLSLRFNRVMDLPSVETGWQISPPLPGRWQTQGQTLAYTLTQPARYGQTYQITLAQAQDSQGTSLSIPWKAQFQTPPRQWVTIGVTGEQAGRLLLVDVDRPGVTPLTPASLRVLEAQSGGERIAFLATAATASGDQTKTLYTWEQGRIQPRLDNQDQEILQFQLSPDGHLLVAERIDPRQAGVTALWQLRGSRWHQLPSQVSGGDFLITPDNSSVLISQGQGLGLVPLQGSPADITFLSRYGQALAMKRDGTAATMIEFHSDYRRTLWLVTNTNEQKPIFETEGAILATAIDPVAPVIYSLVTERDPETWSESPVLLAINWETGDLIEIGRATFPEEMSFAVVPDGSGLIYSVMTPGTGIPLSPSGQRVSQARTFWVPLANGQPTLPATSLEIQGVGVQWLY